MLDRAFDDSIPSGVDLRNSHGMRFPVCRMLAFGQMRPGAFSASIVLNRFRAPLMKRLSHFSILCERQA